MMTLETIVRKRTPATPCVGSDIAFRRGTLGPWDSFLDT